MTWANWTTALWFLPLIPAVILLYFLKLKRRDIEVSSTLLWSRALKDRRVNSPFQRLRKSLLLLLQLLVLGALILALAQPEHQSESKQGQIHFILLDRSASMAAEESGETRFELAKKEANKYLNAIPKGDLAQIIVFAKNVQALTSISDDFSKHSRALHSSSVSHQEGSLDDAIELALSLAASLSPGSESSAPPSSSIVLFSDGGLPKWSGGEIPLPFEYHAVGKSTENCGIVALSSRLDLAAGGRPQIWVEVKNSGLKESKGFVSLQQEGNILAAAEVSIQPGESWKESFEAPSYGLIEVKWEAETEDSLALDDVAWLQIEERPDTQVWRVGPAYSPIDEALKVLPRNQFTYVDPMDLQEELATTTQLPNLIVWDSPAPADLPKAMGHLILGAENCSQWPESSQSNSEFPPVISWDRGHEVNRFINYSNLLIEKSPVLEAIPASHAILETNGGALVSSFSTESSRALLIAFDLEKSNWPLDLSFPFFVHNAVNYLAGIEFGKIQIYHSGDVLSLKTQAIQSPVEVTKPSGQQSEAKTDLQGRIRFADTQKIGLYKFKWAKAGLIEETANAEADHEQRTMTVNLLSQRESNIVVLQDLQIGSQEIEAAASIRASLRDYWPYLLGLAMILLMVEWFYFHHR